MPYRFWGLLDSCLAANELPIPKQVATCLKLNEEPLADTARYDSLHDQEVSHV